MEPQFSDRTLKCADCQAEFIFTAGEQIFFHDKQFRNDPKRCKPCKSRRANLSAVASGAGPVAAAAPRPETRTLCSECGIETTVPFKPTQGRPVLCRSCFQLKARAVSTKPMPAPGVASAPYGPGAAVAALCALSTNQAGAVLSQDAAVLAVASMAGAPAHSSVATAADLASISELELQPRPAGSGVPVELVASAGAEGCTLELLAAAAEAPEA